MFISFSSAIISFINSCWNFDLNYLCLVGVDSVDSVASFGVVSIGSAACAAAGSGVGSRVGILSTFLL